MTQLFKQDKRLERLEHELHRVLKLFTDELFTQYHYGLLSLSGFQEESRKIKNIIMQELDAIKEMMLMSKTPGRERLEDEAQENINVIQRRFGLQL